MYIYICISIFQNEKNQIMKSNVWLRLVSYFVYIKRKFNSHRYGLWSTEYLFKIFLEINNIHHFLGMEWLPVTVGRSRLWRYQCAQVTTRQSLETRHRAIQQVIPFSFLLWNKYFISLLSYVLMSPCVVSLIKFLKSFISIFEEIFQSSVALLVLYRFWKI